MSGAKWCLRGWPLVSWLPWLHSVSREALAPLFFNRASLIAEHQDGATCDSDARWLLHRQGQGRCRERAAIAEATEGSTRRVDGVSWGRTARRCRRRKALDALGMGRGEWRWDGMGCARGRRRIARPADEQMVGSLPHFSLSGLLTKRRTRPVGCSSSTRVDAPINGVAHTISNTQRISICIFRGRMAAAGLCLVMPRFSAAAFPCHRLLNAGRSSSHRAHSQPRQRARLKHLRMELPVHRPATPHCPLQTM